MISAYMENRLGNKIVQKHKVYNMIHFFFFFISGIHDMTATHAYT